MSPSDLVDRIFEGPDIAVSRDRLMRFMIAASRQLPALPEVAAHALDACERFWLGRGSSEELLQHRVACWEFIDSIGSSTDTTDPRARATRAVICLLHADWMSMSHDDAFDLVRFFVELVDRHDDQRVMLVAQLETLFERPI